MNKLHKYPIESVLSASPQPVDGDLIGDILRAPAVADWSDAESLIGAARAFHSTLQLVDLYEIVVKVVASLTGAEGAILLLHRPRTHHLINFKLWSRGFENTENLPSDLGESFISWLNGRDNSRDPFAAPPAPVSEALREMVNVKITTEQWVPIVTPERVMGVVGVYATDAHPGRRIKTLMIPLAEQATAALNNALLYRHVERQSLETQTLLEASQTLLSSHGLDEVLDAILDTLHRVLPYNAGGIFLVDSQGAVERIIDRGYHDQDAGATVPLEQKARRGLVGWVAEHACPLIINDVSQDKRYQCARTETNSEMVVPIFSEDRLVGVFNLERDSVDGFLEADLDLVAAFAQHAGVGLERARAHAATMAQRRLASELEVARHIQQTFLPNAHPDIPGFDIAGANIPSAQVGGDYYDFLPINKDQIGIAIADVTGKGVPAALIMASFRASLIAEIRSHHTLRHVMRKVNQLMCGRDDESRFVTAFYGVLDTRNRIFTFSNAGHDPGILRRADGTVTMLGDGGLAFGIFADSDYEISAFGLLPGDVILLYTDGVTDTIGKDKSMFEIERLIDVVHAYAHRTAQEIVDAVLAALDKFADPGAPVDDVTLVCIRVAEAPST